MHAMFPAPVMGCRDAVGLLRGPGGATKHEEKVLLGVAAGHAPRAAAKEVERHLAVVRSAGDRLQPQDNVWTKETLCLKA